ncbi:hypothetical protein EsH8_XV_000040 [Colletotrichum jinshuiense]
MSLKRLLNDVDDDGHRQNPDPSFISPHGSISGSSHQSADDNSGKCPRQTQFQGMGMNMDYTNKTPVLAESSSLADVFNIILFDDENQHSDTTDPLRNLNLNLGTEDAPYNLDFELETGGQQRMAMASPGGSCASQPSLSGSGSSADSMPATHTSSYDPDHIVIDSDTCLPAGDEDFDKVCYGMLYNVDVKLIGDMAVIDSKLDAAHQAVMTSGLIQYQCFVLSEQQDHVLLTFKDNTEFGYLHSGPGKILSPLFGVVDFEPIAPIVALRETIARAKKPAEAMVKVDINVYGPRRTAQDVGEKLSEGRLWLQKPDYSRRGLDYKNPHMLQHDWVEELDFEVARQVGGGGSAKRQPRDENLRKIMMEVYQSLDKNRDLDKVDAGEGLKNKLLIHQQEALGFMLERESGCFHERYRLWKPVMFDGNNWYRHKITNLKRRTTPEERGGGILADEAGMGKSLSILSLIVKTLQSGREWAEQENSNDDKLTDISYSGSTLVVVPSALLIHNWTNEIDKHVQGNLRTIKYHGPGREKDIDKIKNSQIVVTTYNTLSTEFKKKSSLLHKISWYRVVLDEAHIIRRTASTFYHACRALYANSRWCLTGTPIQNKLSDIAALFAFVRAKPFDEPAVFRRYFELPFEQSEENTQMVIERLNLLMQSVCLRRTKELLNLPGTREVMKELTFSPEEREQYDATLKIFIRALKVKVGESSKSAMSQTNLQMRLLCNHGTYQKNFSWQRKAYLHDERETAANALGRNVDITCGGCRQPMPILGSSKLRNDFEEQCAHVICSECLEDTKESKTSTKSIRQHCPLCQDWMKSVETQRQALPLVGVDGPSDAEDVEMEDGPSHHTPQDKDDSYFRTTGYSTKIRALINDLRVDLTETKSIVFSCWTRTLNLVETHLKQVGIAYLRIDGSDSQKQRQEAMLEFANSLDNRVLLTTTCVAALGLNLTCANRVFIIEPQWNPNIEDQATSRALRLGQNRTVTVTRYIVRNSVEQQMQSQQISKRLIAAIPFNESIFIDTIE